MSNGRVIEQIPGGGFIIEVSGDLKVGDQLALVQPSFQQRVQPWMMACFGPEISADKVERNHRFLEEALELVQACGCTMSEAHQLVEYVFNRPVGEKSQEVGGVRVTLSALCLAQEINEDQAAETELARINQPQIIEKIRAKQAAKPKHSPLPAGAAVGLINVIAFAQEIMNIWPHGDVDGGDLQNIAEKHGLLTPETFHEPCQESGCNCSGMWSADEWEAGVTCYRKAQILVKSTQSGQEMSKPSCPKHDTGGGPCYCDHPTEFDIPHFLRKGND